MNKMKIFLLVSMGLFLAVACGDDEGDDAPTVSSSVDNSKTVSDLSSEEVVDVCEDIYAGMDAASDEMLASFDDTLCQSVGVSAAGMEYFMGGGDVADADLVAACEEAVTECEDAESEFVEDGDDDDDIDEICGSAEAIIGECDITVGEMIDCFNAELASEQAELDAMKKALPSCGDLSADTFENMEEVEQPEATVPAACEAVYEACPALAMM